MKIIITGGHVSDFKVAREMVEGLPVAKAFVGDKGYDSQPLVDFVAGLGGEAHIPTRRHLKHQRYVPPEIYRLRNLVERFFCKLKQFRRAATRFDKLARNFLAAIALACTRLWLRKVESTS